MTTKLFVLVTEHDGESADVSLHGTREDAETALRKLARLEWAEAEDPFTPSPPTTASECKEFLIYHSGGADYVGYVDVRLLSAEVGAGPGDPIDLDATA